MELNKQTASLLVLQNSCPDFPHRTVITRGKHRVMYFYHVSPTLQQHPNCIINVSVVGEIAPNYEVLERAPLQWRLMFRLYELSTLL